MTKDDEKKLNALRAIMRKQSLAAYLQPVHDEYLSEYPPDCNQRVKWLTGFSGSAGMVAILAGIAALFTDGRYTLQAKNEVDGALFEQHNSGDKTPEAWLAESIGPLPNPPPQAGEGTVRVGYDPKLYTRAMLKRMQPVLEKKNIALVSVENLVDMIWADRPVAPASPVFVHDIAYAGETSASKRRRIAEKIKAAGADACVFTAPDAICWLLNIRASDVEGTPLALSNALLHGNGQVQLYLAPSRCSGEVRAHLGGEVALCDPAALEAGLRALKNKRVLCDPASVPVWFMQVLEEAGAKIVEGENPCVLAKAMKNAVELQGMRNAHIRDGVAVVKLLCWLEMQVREVTELEIADKLLLLRAAQALFVEPSFPTIAGSGPHGAIVHYRASPESNRAVRQGELLLLDSGGQYFDGTTDITRTVPIGAPTAEHKNRFTRVLKGHIAIATALFPQGTAGSQLDALARQYLWQDGLDYDHGTGHGVGCFLGVHEGPQRISKRGGDAALAAGMIISNEPGYYKAGEYGIRIESLVVVKPVDGGRWTVKQEILSTAHCPPSTGWLAFETITCVPIDTRLVEVGMLTAAEKEWLNAYHAWVLSQLAEKLDEQEREWLNSRCARLSS